MFFPRCRNALGAARYIIFGAKIMSGNQTGVVLNVLPVTLTLRYFLFKMMLLSHRIIGIDEFVGHNHLSLGEAPPVH